MRVLLIGGTGYLGRSLCTALTRGGHEVLVALHKQPYARSEHAEARAVASPLQDTDSSARLLDAERPDVVVHLASGLVPASSAAEYLQERALVIDPTFQLLLQLAARHIPLVFFSSGGTIYGPSGADRLDEESACRPISFYGQAKLEMEEIIRFVGRTTDLSWLILRPSNPFGGSQLLRGRQGLIAAVLGCARDRQPLQIWGDGRVVRDYIYIDDLSDAVVHLIVRQATGVINLGSGTGVSTIDAVRTAESIISRPIALEFAPGRAVDVPRVVLDCTRAAELGTATPRPFIDGIRQFAIDCGLV